MYMFSHSVDGTFVYVFMHKFSIRTLRFLSTFEFTSRCNNIRQCLPKLLNINKANFYHVPNLNLFNKLFFNATKHKLIILLIISQGSKKFFYQSSIILWVSNFKLLEDPSFDEMLKNVYEFILLKNVHNINFIFVFSLQGISFQRFSLKGGKWPTTLPQKPFTIIDCIAYNNIDHNIYVGIGWNQ